MVKRTKTALIATILGLFLVSGVVVYAASLRGKNAEQVSSCCGNGSACCPDGTTEANCCK